MPNKNEPEGYALVFWIREKLSDVVDLKCIPPTKRRPNSTAMLNWESHLTGENTREEAKIIAVDAKKAVLDRIILDQNGDIVDAGTKVFSKSIMTEKKNMESKRKSKKTNAATSKKALSIDINKQESLMNIALKKTKTPHGNKDKFSTPALRRSPRLSPRVSYNDESRHTVAVHQSQSSDSGISGLPPPFDLTAESDSEVPYGAGLIVGPTEEERHPVSLSMFLNQVTQRDIQSQRLLLALMEDAVQKRTGESVKHEHINVFEIPDRFTQPGKEKVEIAPGCGIYFPQYIIYKIENAFTNQQTGYFDWENALRDALLEVYGNNIKNFSGKGSRVGSRPGISRKVYNALYYWLSRKENLLSELDDPTFNTVINNFAYNKRKHGNQTTGMKSEKRGAAGKRRKRSASTASGDTPGSSDEVKRKEESNVFLSSDKTPPQKPLINPKRKRQVDLNKENESASGDADDAAGVEEIQVSDELQVPSPRVFSAQSGDQQLSKQNDWSYSGNLHPNHEPTRQSQWYPDSSQKPVNSPGQGYPSWEVWSNGNLYNQHYGHHKYVNNAPYHHQYQGQPFTPLQNMPTAYPQASTPSFPFDSSYGYAQVQTPAYTQHSVPTTATITSGHQHLQPLSNTQASSVSPAATEYSG